MPTYLSPGVYVEEVEAGSRPIEGVGTAVAAFVGFAADGPFNEPTLVSNWSQFTKTFGEFVEGGYLAHAVYGFFANGGGAAFIVRVGNNGSDDGRQGSDSDAKQAVIGGYRVLALDEGSGSEDITVEVEPAAAAEGETAPPDDVFKLVVKRGGKVEETYDRVSTKRGKENVLTAVKSSKLISMEETSGSPATRPDVGSATLAAPPPTPATPARISTDDYVGDVGERYRRSPASRRSTR